MELYRKNCCGIFECIQHKHLYSIQKELLPIPSHMASFFNLYRVYSTKTEVSPPFLGISYLCSRTVQGKDNSIFVSQR